MNFTLSLRAGIALVLISLGGMIAESAVAQGPPGGGFRGGDSGRGSGGPGGGFRGPGGDRGGDRGPGGDRGGPGGDRGRGGDDRGSRGGWGGDRGRGGDDRGGRGGDDRGRGGQPNFDPTEWLRRMDRDRNGQLEGDELEGRGGEFVKRMLAGTGMENSSSIKIDAAGEAIQKAREAREKGIESASMSFGESSEVALAVGFDAAPPLSTKALEDKYGKSVVDSTMSMLQRYDKNKNYYLDGTEWKDVRWFGGDPTSFDKDKDGRLSMEELSARTASTRGGGSSTSDQGASSGSSRGGDRGGDRGSSRGSDRGGSEERGRGGFGGFGSRGGFGGGPGGGGPGGFGGGPGGGGPGGSRGGRGGFFGGGGNDEDRFKSIAEMQMRQYDENENGFVDGDELEKIRGGNALDYDKNNDRKISLDEMIERMKGFAQRGFGGRGGDRGDRSSRGGDRSSSSDTASKPTSYRFLSATERLPDGLPSWFIRSDADEDGQIMMHEFSTTWSDSRVTEFAEYDLNGDGVITAKECLAVEGR